MAKTILTPPELLDDVMEEELSQIFQVWLLPEGFLEELYDLCLLNFSKHTDFLLILGIMNEKHENIFKLVIVLRTQSSVSLKEELSGVLS